MFLRLPDTELEKFLKFFTFYDFESIEQIIQKHLKKQSSRYGQERLAEIVTLLVHGGII